MTRPEPEVLELRGSDVYGPAWFVVRCHGGREKTALASITEQKLGAYLPQEKLWARHAGRRYETTRPLFVGYLFVHMRVDEQHLLHDLQGVAGLLKNGGGPVPIPDLVVASMILAQHLGAFDKTATGKTKLVEGDAVKVTGGKFTGFLGKVCESRPRDRVSILLSHLGKYWPMTVPVAQLEKA